MGNGIQRSALKVIAAALLVCAAAAAAGALREARGEPAPGGTRFHFVQISDTHLGERDHLERARRVVARVNALPFDIACVVHTGDLFADNITDATLLEEALGVFKALKAPLHVVAGNHDILREDLERTRAAFVERVGGLAGRAVYHGVVFAFAYTEPLALGFRLPGYDPLREIAAALAETAGRPVLFFHHRPAVADFYANATHPGWDPQARLALARLLGGLDVKAVITGHFHRDELHWAGGVPVFAAPPVAGYWGRQAAFRVYDYEDGRIGYRTVYLPD